MKWRDPIFMDYLRIASDLRGDEIDQIKAFGIDPAPHRIALLSQDFPGPKFTFIDETRNVPPLVTGGFIPHEQPGVYRSWFLASDYAWEHYGREISILTVKCIDHMFESGMTRVETVCLASRKTAHRWYQRAIGMHREPTQARALDGRELALFVKERGSV